MSPGHSFFVTRTYEGADNPGKRGAKPYFSGSRQKLLEEHLEEYVSLRHKSQNKFWSEFLAKWWELFPWKLGNKEEAPLNNPSKMSELASVQPGERNRKSEVEAAVIAVSLTSSSANGENLMTMDQQIKQWFAYQSQNQHTCTDNSGLFHILQRLHESINPKPRR